MAQTPPSDTRDKLYGLDHLRALAIIIVFLFHYPIVTGGEPSWLASVSQFGWTGVDLFFVLSGFLISSQLFAQIRQGRPLSLRGFFIKRFMRILPAYWVVVAVYFCCPPFREKEALPPLWQFLTFTQNFGLNLKDYGTFSHAWSLCVEEHFYLLLPFTLIALQASRLLRKAYWLIPALVLSGIAIRMYSYHLYEAYADSASPWIYWYQYVYYPTYCRLDGLVTGVAIAAMYQFLPDVWQRVSRYGDWLIAGGVLVLAGAYFLCTDMTTFTASIFGFPLVSLGYGLMVMGAIAPGSFLYRWQSRATTFIATLSYAIYLSHKGIIHLTHTALSSYISSSNAILSISIIACLIAAYGLHLIVEKPFMKLRRRILG